jgi:hypothetical protein
MGVAVIQREAVAAGAHEAERVAVRGGEGRVTVGRDVDAGIVRVGS